MSDRNAERYDDEQLRQIYDDENGNVSAVARRVGRPRETVRDRLERLGIHQSETPLYLKIQQEADA